MIKHIGVDNFEDEVIKNKKIVVVDFFATWCGPCNMLSPILEKISEERDDFEIVKVDIDKNKELAYKYEIMAVPTLLFFKNGQVANEVEGAIGEDEFIENVEKCK